MKDEELEALAHQAEDDDTFVRRVRKMEDFRYDEQQEKYWDMTTGHLLAAKSVDGAIPVEHWPTKPDGRSGQLKPYAPSKAINAVDTGLTVEGSTWWPGLPRIAENVVMTERGVIHVKGAACFNAYIEPEHDLPAKADAKPWIDHVKKLYPDPVEHEAFFDFCAHMIQRPDQKVNHGIVMAGSQGIGKDTALLPVRHGVGIWNSAEVDPDAITSQYNGHLKSVLLIINEVRPHDEDHKASNFYNMLKPLLASPPEMLPMTLKYANTIHIRNLCHVILTTNDPLGMYIPREDRRLLVMTSAMKDPKVGGDFAPDYFAKLHAWLDGRGKEHVIKWLKDRSLKHYKPAAPPPMTRGKKAIIESANQVRRTMVDELLEDYAEALGDQDVIFHRDLTQFATELFDDREALLKSLNTKSFHFKMSERGYDLVRNPDAAEWRNGTYRTRMAFIKREVPMAEQIETIRTALEARPLDMDHIKKGR